MNVDRPALMALVLFGLLGLGFAVVGLSLYRPATAPNSTDGPRQKKGVETPELLPLPRVVESVSRALHFSISSPGLAVEEMEQTTVRPLEQGLMRLEGRVSLQTRVQQGRARLTLELAADRDLNQARAEAIDLINGAAAFLPPGVPPPVLERRDPDALPVLLKEVAKLERTETAAVLDRFNGQRCAAITANPAPERTAEAAQANLHKIATATCDKLKLPESFKIIGD